MLTVPSDDVDAFLAECDDVIDDWNGSADSASWSADGSHEVDTDGNYYAEDPRPRSTLFRPPATLSPPPRVRVTLEWEGLQVATFRAELEIERNGRDIIRVIARPIGPAIPTASTARLYDQ
ncbi:hypothetical protein G9U51_08350 [Calidifontibacter sp. DB0510]|uniref:Uncharacterized protein n=1 Tax=Metallococcus carri TaxID=1656884 RepID=A0A967EEL5_9MICO|nr:hypothetical protein [Metallococcus carri]NHN55786.1 hypothetical protein [Metallococcus carri]NOP38525.1 hypothetical protein [Calidifontibacter sp. DB2511S]